MAKRVRKTVTLVCKLGRGTLKGRKVGKGRKASKSRKSSKLPCVPGTYKMKKLGRAGKRCTCKNTGGNRVIIKTARCKGKK